MPVSPRLPPPLEMDELVPGRHFSRTANKKNFDLPPCFLAELFPDTMNASVIGSAVVQSAGVVYPSPQVLSANRNQPDQFPQNINMFAGATPSTVSATPVLQHTQEYGGGLCHGAPMQSPLLPPPACPQRSQELLEARIKAGFVDCEGRAVPDEKFASMHSNMLVFSHLHCLEFKNRQMFCRWA